MIVMHPGLIHRSFRFQILADTFIHLSRMPVILSLVYTEVSLSTCAGWIPDKSDLYYVLLPHLSIKRKEKKIPFRYFPRGDHGSDESDLQSLQVGLCLTCKNPFKWHRGLIILFCGP